MKPRKKMKKESSAKKQTRDPCKVITGVCRSTFMNVVTKKRNEKNPDKSAYGCVAIIPKKMKIQLKPLKKQ